MYNDFTKRNQKYTGIFMKRKEERRKHQQRWPIENNTSNQFAKSEKGDYARRVSFSELYINNTPHYSFHDEWRSFNLTELLNIKDRFYFPNLTWEEITEEEYNKQYLVPKLEKQIKEIMEK